MTLRELRSGEGTHDFRLDRCKEVDLRTLNHPVQAILSTEQMNSPRSYTWRIGSVLDQGAQGSCVGHGFCHEAIARPIEIDLDTKYAKEKIYWEAQKEDPWDGGSFPGASPFMEGSSVSAGAKVCQRIGFFESYKWAFDIKDLAVAIGYYGPAVIGVDWYADMFDTDADGFIHATGKVQGGHCVCVIGVRLFRVDPFKDRIWDNIDFLKSHFLIVNSWGPSWGANGRAKISFVDMMKLWPGGEFCIPVDRKRPTPEED